MSQAAANATIYVILTNGVRNTAVVHTDGADMKEQNLLRKVKTMKLIDADALIEFVDPGHLRHPGEATFSELDVVNMLNHAPTAYDVDKVLMCLDGRAEDCREKGRMLEEAGMEDASRKMYAKAYSYEEAIRIVKGGCKL